MVCGGMLAVDGGALALIAIRRTGIAPNERGRFARIGQARSADVARRSFRRCSALSAPSQWRRRVALRNPGLSRLDQCAIDGKANLRAGRARPREGRGPHDGMFLKSMVGSWRHRCALRLFKIARRSAALPHALSCSSSDLASIKSSVSKPSVNQP